jgi:hypothetical protein
MDLILEPGRAEKITGVISGAIARREKTLALFDRLG